MSTEVSHQPHAPADRHRRKPFSTFIRRLANLKSSSHNRGSTSQANGVSFDTTTNNNGGSSSSRGGGHSISLHHRRRSGDASTRPPTQSTSTAFSSPSHSLRSLTTLTTVQSTAPPSTYLPNGQHSSYNPHPQHHHNPNGPVQLFTHQYPTHSPQASTSTSGGPGTPAAQLALSNATTPGAFTPGGTVAGAAGNLLQPATYNSLTHGGMLTDNASIITIASSSKRRRRSLDTDASIRAVAPSSLWGGSRESLPLSVLSGNLESRTGDRASLYSTTIMGGAASIKDRDSVAGLMIAGGGGGGGGTGGTGSPLVSPRDGAFPIGSSGLASGADGNEEEQEGFTDKGRARRPSTGTSLVGTVESVAESDVPDVPPVDKEKHGKDKQKANANTTADVPDAGKE